MYDEPGDGAEAFSLMRDSSLGSEEYLTRWFDDGNERQGDVEDEQEAGDDPGGPSRGTPT